MSTPMLRVVTENDERLLLLDATGARVEINVEGHTYNIAVSGTDLRIYVPGGRQLIVRPVNESTIRFRGELRQA